MYLIIILLCVFLCVFLGVLMIAWGIHVSMNVGENLPYDFVTFKTFMKKFDKYKDDPDLRKYEWSVKSIFLDKDNEHVYLHAQIVKFNEKCMIFYPFDYLKYCIWMRKFNRKPKESYRIKGLWKEIQS